MEDSKPVFSRLLRLLGPQKRLILPGVVLLLMSMPAELFPAFVWMYVVDGLIQHNQTFAIRVLHSWFSFGEHLTSWPALLASALCWLTVVYIVGETLETFSSNLMQRAAEKFILDFRGRVYRKLQCQSLSYLQKQRTGDLMSRAIGDIDELRSFVVGSIDVIIGEGLLWVLTVVIVMLLDWRVATLSMLPLVAVYFLLRVFNRRAQAIYQAARTSAGKMSTRIQENLSGVVVIKIFGREDEEARRFDETAGQYYRDQIRAINARTVYFPFARAVGFFSNVFMIGMGGYSILSGGSFTLGKLLAFRAYWFRLFGPVQTLARVNDMVQRASAAGRRVFELLDAPDELPDHANAARLSHVQGGMTLDRVDFSYYPTATPTPPMVLHDISIDIPAGKTVALAGPSGSGKSTILNLLLRFYDPTSGVVQLDGHNLRDLARDSFRSQMALVQQETFLFSESIIDNIRYGHAEATMEQVVAAAKAANAHGFISRLPQGYDTQVGERGVRLSGGQKQRISIARAFLANPRILLLDEPTSSVEPDSEAAIIAAIDRLMVGRTTVVTSHRPSLVAQAEMVYVIDEGKLVARGTVDEVRAHNAWFDRFMRSAEDLSEDVPSV